MPILKVEHVKKLFGNLNVLKDISFELNAGEVLSIIGPSGSGKSTLLRCITQLETVNGGLVQVDGKDMVQSGDKGTPVYAPAKVLREIRLSTGLVFQNFNLFPHLTVLQNLCLAPVRVLGVSREQARETGRSLLKRMGLEGKEKAYPCELSGGQQQRVSIARALAMNPKILFFDEPTSALDPELTGEVLKIIKKLAEDKMTMVIVTHEMAFARAISNRVFYMDEGKIYEDGTPQQIFDDPKREKTRRFVRKLKVLELNIESRDYDFPAAVSQIEQYCSKNQIDSNTGRRIQLAYEETVQNLLLPKLRSPQIKVVAEYSAADEHTVVTIYYNGITFDAAKDGDALSLAVLQTAVSEMKYRAGANGQYTNEIELIIKH